MAASFDLQKLELIDYNIDMLNSAAPLVLDPGSHVWKAGFAGDDARTALGLFGSPDSAVSCRSSRCVSGRYWQASCPSEGGHGSANQSLVGRGRGGVEA